MREAFEKAKSELGMAHYSLFSEKFSADLEKLAERMCKWQTEQDTEICKQRVQFLVDNGYEKEAREVSSIEEAIRNQEKE